jgi:hypothetical protein
MAFRISVFQQTKVSMESRGKSLMSSNSRTEMARASFLSRLCPASCKKVGGALRLILKDL